MAILLAERNVSAEVIDLRTLRPIDVETVVRSLEKTNRIAVVEEGPITGGWAGEVLALVSEHADPVQPTARGRVPAERTTRGGRSAEQSMKTYITRRKHG